VTLRKRPSVAELFERLYSEKHAKQLEHFIVTLSALGFVAHLALVFLARHLRHPPLLIAAVGNSYLSAIYTPFSIILFYEVLVLIAAIPKSMTQSIAGQFEIVSLIFIRSFFKEIAHFDMEDIKQPARELLPAFIDVGAGLLMFLLVTIFNHIARQRVADVAGELPAELNRFITRKKIIAMLLTVLFLILAAYAMGDFLFSLNSEMHGGPVRMETRPAFYTDVFTVMIFTDVLILILSLLVSDRYEFVFRNAAFVIATILIRFSLTAGAPYGALIGVAAMVFGIVTLLIYNYNTRVMHRR
jgi:hypothetical protein